MNRLVATLTIALVFFSILTFPSNYGCHETETMESLSTLRSVNISGSSRIITYPLVKTVEPTDIDTDSANLWSELVDTGGEPSSVWFEWDEFTQDPERNLDKNIGLDECAGMIATGSVCKDGRSIVLKNRHTQEDNQKPRFYSGSNYTYFGVGSTDNMCRMGQNEAGLAIANFDAVDTMTNWQYTSDGSSGSEDNDLHTVLGNYSTVAAAAFWLAHHGFHPGQNVIISSERGVGAIVGVDSNLHSSITWINNTYAGVANSFYCDDAIDVDCNDKRTTELLEDIINNGTSSDRDNKINWKDVAQRIGKDTSDKELGTGIFCYSNEISRGSSRAALVAVSGAGFDSLNSSLFMSWLNFAPNTQIGIFLPIYAGILQGPEDIPKDLSSENNGKGIFPYTELKHDYARAGCPVDYYNCARVREIQRYAEYNENITFDEFDDVIGTIIRESSGVEDPAKTALSKFVNQTLPIALDGYINNLSAKGKMTEKQKLNQLGPFNQTLNGLEPGRMYEYRAWVNNSKYMANGSKMLFLTKPEAPGNIQVATLDQTNLNLSWVLGTGANTTIIERNTHEAWPLGDGIMIYNGTNNYYKDTGLEDGTRYFYQFWSFTSIFDKYQLNPLYVSYNASTQHENRAPEITTIPLTHAVENELYELMLFCIEPDGDYVTWSVKTNAYWLNLTGTILSGHPGDLDVGPYYVNISCDDNNGSIVYSNFTLSIIAVPDAPIILKLLNNIEFLEDSFYILDLTGLGADLDGDELTWYFADVDNGLLDIAKIGLEMFNLSSLPDQFGSNRVKLFLEDNSEENLQTFQIFWINVLPVNDSPMQPQILYEISDSDPKTPGNQNLTVSFTAIPPKDIDTDVNFTYSWDFNDDGTVDSTDQNLIKINYTYPSAGEYLIKLTVTDTGGLSNFTKLTLVVTAPNTTGDTADKPQASSANDASMFYFGIIGTVIMVIMIKIILMLKRRKHITNQAEQKSQNNDIKKQDQKE